MSPLDRLLAEEIPTGRVRDHEPARRRPWTEQEQARHRADLLAALDEKPLRVGRRAAPARHLHAIPPAA